MRMIRWAFAPSNCYFLKRYSNQNIVVMLDQVWFNNLIKTVIKSLTPFLMSAGSLKPCASLLPFCSHLGKLIRRPKCSLFGISAKLKPQKFVLIHGKLTLAPSLTTIKPYHLLIMSPLPNWCVNVNSSLFSHSIVSDALQYHAACQASPSFPIFQSILELTQTHAH